MLFFEPALLIPCAVTTKLLYTHVLDIATSFASHSVFLIKDVNVLWPEPGLTQVESALGGVWILKNLVTWSTASGLSVF